jgi:Flp pilus assembly protein CpaB
MNRSRTLILLGVVLLLGAVAILVLTQQGTGTPQASLQPTPIPEPPSTVILVAAQDIPRGAIIGPDAVVVAKWPNSSLPPNDLIISSPDQVKGQRARTDIYRGQPILQKMITSNAADLSATGYDAALFIPPGKVAVSFPIDQLSDVGYAVGAGDHVDLMVSFSVVDVNQDGQYPITPFNQDLYDQLRSTGAPADQALSAALAQMGKSEQPRLQAQLALQNIEVLHVGEWPASGQLPKPESTPTDQSAPPPPAGTPTPLPPRPTLLILLVDQQQALLLQWLRQAKVTVELALRAAGDNAPVSTDTVSYQYVLTSFNITIPPKLNTIIQNPVTPGQ